MQVNSGREIILRAVEDRLKAIEEPAYWTTPRTVSRGKFDPGAVFDAAQLPVLYIKAGPEERIEEPTGVGNWRWTIEIYGFAYDDTGSGFELERLLRDVKRCGINSETGLAVGTWESGIGQITGCRIARVETALDPIAPQGSFRLDLEVDFFDPLALA